jgi:glycine cleavage system regulatory protein
MRKPIVMTVIGRDRPGIVETLASLVASHEGNWLESRMCRLGGEFAGILRVELPATRHDELRLALQNLASHGLTVIAREDTPAPSAEGLRLVFVEIVGHDRPGIVREISRVLAGRHVNVEDLETERTSAPMTGEMLFKAKARLGLPAGCDAAQLRAELEKIAGDLMVDVSFEELA